MRILAYSLIFFFSLSAKSQNRTMGTLLNTEASYNGYTLFSNNEWSYLIDNCGYIINSWESDYKSGHGIYLLPTGRLIRAGTTPSNIFHAGGRGGILELFDWNGARLWKYEIADELIHAHHDLAVLPNGNFLCTVWELKSASEAAAKGRRNPQEMWSEKILEIKMLPNNKADIVWEWSVWDHLIQDYDSDLDNYAVVAHHPELIDINYNSIEQGDDESWLHFNSIAYNSDFDQIVVSSRNYSEFYVLDHSTSLAESQSHTGGRYGKGGDILYRYGNPEAYQSGDQSPSRLNRQHHVEWVSFGSPPQSAFSVFNNEYQKGQQSRIQFSANPVDDNGHYHFNDEELFGPDTLIKTFTSHELYSDILSGIQLLPNGNLLILEGRSGHIFELNESEDIVWEYINPVNRNGGPGIQGGTPQFNQLFRAIRYAPDFAGFSGKELVPGQTVEFSTGNPDCSPFDSVSTHDESQHEINDRIKIICNPIFNHIIIELEDGESADGFLYNSIGQKVATLRLTMGYNNIPIPDIPAGIYLFVTEHTVHKIMKI